MALGGVEIGRHIPSEQPRAITMAISAAPLETDTANPIPIGTSRLAEAEWEITLEVTQPTRAKTKISSRPGMEVQSIEPSIHLSRPVALTPEPSAIPPATSHSTGQSKARKSSPLITLVISSTTTGKKPTMFEEMWCRDSVIHSKIVSPATQ